MNRIQISGTISGLAFHASVGTFILCCGEAQTVPVAAIRNAAQELEQFQDDDLISVEGRIVWNAGKIEILAESIRQHREGVYRKRAQQDKFPRQVLGMRGVPIP